MAMTSLDPITLEMLWRRLNATVDELAATLVRTSFSTVVRDVNDYACSIFDADARLLAQSSESTPGLCGPLGSMLRHMLQVYPRDALRPGDVLIGNDPWSGTGHHNDITVATPAYHDDRLIGFAVCTAHHTDIGGRRATTESRDNYEEGLRIPVRKIYRAGVANDDVFAFIRENVRSSDKVVGDLRAQFAANHVASQRLRDICVEQAWDDLQVLADEVVARSEALTRAEIAKIPNGVYEHEAPIDVVDGATITIRTAVRVSDDEIVVDYAGSSAQVARAINATLTYASAYTVFALKCVLNVPVPMNEGTLRPLRVTAPPGSILNATFPAPVFARTAVGNFLAEMVMTALARVLPDRVTAGSGATPLWAQYLLGRRRDGAEFAPLNAANGGLGARANQDGVSCLAFPFNIANTPVEILESEVPVLCEKRALWVNSAGPGRFRGGLGQEFVLRVLGGEFGPDGSMLMGFRGGRFYFPVPGLLGGGEAPKAELLVNGKPETSGRQVVLTPGDVVTCRIPGGGGIGDPWERDRGRVEQDLKNGLITEDHARARYGWTPGHAPEAR